jgi:nucleotide-binding universal stress UspA family protein
MKNILVPIDFSACSRQGAQAAVFLARRLKSRIHLLHLTYVSPEHEGGITSEEIAARIVEAEKRLKKLRDSKLFSKVDVTVTVETGVAYDRIIEIAHSRKVDMIVMGAHGAGETDQLFVGSTTQRVIRTANCPVLSIKKGQKLSSIRRIMLPSDIEENASKTMTPIIDLAEKLGAEIDLTFINTPEKFADTATAEKRMNRLIRKNTTAKTNLFIYNDFGREQGILNFLKRRKPQIVSLVTHARRGKPSYVTSVTDTVLLHADVPVISTLLKNR